MKTMKNLIFFGLLFIFTNQTFAGGGWVFEKNRGYFKVSQNMIRSGYFFDKEGEVVDIPTVSLYTSSLYFEYGLADRINIIGYVPFFVRSTLNEVKFNQSGNTIPGDAINSFGDTDLQIKYGIIKNKGVVASASLLFGLPLGSSEVSKDRILQTGDGEFNQMIRLDVSHSLYPKPLYISGYIGFNNRTQGFSDEIRWGGEIGWTPGKFIVIMKVDSRNSLYNGLSEESSANGIFANNIEYFSYTPEVNYKLNDQFGFSAAAGLALSGKRILAAPNFSLGGFFTF